MFCQKCGKEIKDTAKFCGYCGSINEPIITHSSSQLGENNATTPPWLNPEIKRNTSTLSVKQSQDIKTEISQNAVLFAMPILYLVWQIARIFLNIHFARNGYDSYISFAYISAIIGCSLYGAVSGGLVVAINNCSKRFKWLYLIPYAVVCAYFFVTNLNYFESILYSVFEFLEIIVSMGVILAFQTSKIGKENSMKSTIIVAAVSTGVGVLAFRFLYYLLIRIVFGGYASFTAWNIITSLVSIIGAVIGAAVAFGLATTKKPNLPKR